MAQQDSPVWAMHTQPLGEGNHLIDRLPVRERKIVLALCDAVELTYGTVLCEADRPFEHVYFPITGSISLVKTLAGHEPMETELIGCEGMLGVTLVLDISYAPQRGLVQSQSLALRMTASQLLGALGTCPALLSTLRHYLFVVMVQLSQTAGCTRFHDVGTRLARVLLMAHDRARSNRFHLTHQNLADMLGVQRGAVTIAAGLLQRQKIIRYARGEITVINREGLETAACECYAAGMGNYGRLLS